MSNVRARAMSSQRYRCELCGHLLPSADAICTDCDMRLKAEAEINNLRHECPLCKNKIAEFEQILWPENAKWYTAQQQRSRCPSCKGVLRSKYDTKQFRRVNFVLYFVALAVTFLLPRNLYTLSVLIIVWAAYISYGAVVFYRGFRDPIKYVRENEP